MGIRGSYSMNGRILLNQGGRLMINQSMYLLLNSTDNTINNSFTGGGSGPLFKNYVAGIRKSISSKDYVNNIKKNIKINSIMDKI